ncbi:hypothetical protein IWW52_000251 [Coemansia sp. RSA 2704]|nr:hypothetical protein IWW52_000251 [Coemansia sp. RSA 2704]
MATIHDLPAEIIRLFLELLIKRGYATKDSAALLSVSRQWREIVVPMAYSCARISSAASAELSATIGEHGYKMFNTQRAQAAAHCKLIKDNGHFGTVKHLLFEDSAESPRFVQNIVEALALAEYNSEGFSILKRRCDIYDNDEEEFTAEIDGSCRQVIKEFARRTAVVLPNVTTLVVNAEKCHMYVSLYAAELVGYYGKQLRSLRIYCPERIPGPIVAPRLELLGIKMNPAFQPLSFTVEPHSLKSIHLVASNLNLFWNAFTCDQDGALHFPNLETLCFDYPEQDGWAYAEHGQDTPPRMTFPKLKHLIINGYDTDIKDFGYFMSPSLTSVQIYGHWVTALKLCKQLTVPLDVLQLTVDSLDDSSSIGYIEDMSMLFQSIRNIKAVQCRIEVDGA